MKPNARTCLVMITVTLLALLAPALAWADTHIVEVTRTGETEARSETWIGSDRLAAIDENVTMIYRGDLKKLYVIRHAVKSTLVADLPFDVSSVLPPQMAEMMTQMVPEVTITPAEETREIAGYEAKRYDIAISMPMGMSVETIAWVSTEAPVDWTVAREMSDEMTRSMSPQMKGMIEKMSGIEGFQLGSETTQNVMGQLIKSTTMVESIEEKDAPKGVYEPPADYEQKPISMQSFMEMQQGG